MGCKEISNLLLIASCWDSQSRFKIIILLKLFQRITNQVLSVQVNVNVSQNEYEIRVSTTHNLKTHSVFPLLESI